MVCGVTPSKFSERAMDLRLDGETAVLIASNGNSDFWLQLILQAKNFLLGLCDVRAGGKRELSADAFTDRDRRSSVRSIRADSR